MGGASIRRAVGATRRAYTSSRARILEKGLDRCLLGREVMGLLIVRGQNAQPPLLIFRGQNARKIIWVVHLSEPQHPRRPKHSIHVGRTDLEPYQTTPSKHRLPGCGPYPQNWSREKRVEKEWVLVPRCDAPRSGTFCLLLRHFFHRSKSNKINFSTAKTHVCIYLYFCVSADRIKLLRGGRGENLRYKIRMQLSLVG